jgi:hypothetical protein
LVIGHLVIGSLGHLSFGHLVIGHLVIGHLVIGHLVIGHLVIGHWSFGHLVIGHFGDLFVWVVVCLDLMIRAAKIGKALGAFANWALPNFICLLIGRPRSCFRPLRNLTFKKMWFGALGRVA